MGRLSSMRISIVLASLALVLLTATQASGLAPDSSSPTVSIAGPDGVIAAPATARVSATDDDAVAHLTVSLTDASGSRTVFDATDASAPVALDPAVLVGSFVTLHATATDPAGNTATASRTWTVAHGAVAPPPPPTPTLAKARLHLRLRSAQPAAQITRLWLTGVPAGARVRLLLVRAHRASRGYGTVGNGGTVVLTGPVRSVHLISTTRIKIALTLTGAKARNFTVHRSAPSPASPTTGGGGVVGGGGSG